ncbi:MAG: hypothetical protein ACR2P0_10490 [Acidimicrobiales bacterium]
MRSGWKGLGVFALSVVGIVALVLVATRHEPRTSMLLLTQVGFIALMSYLVTFLVWPRKVMIPRSHPSRHTPPGDVPKERALGPDPRPVLVIGDRPAGSRPGSSVHVRDTPTVRGARGRRPDPRSRPEIRWPAQH